MINPASINGPKVIVNKTKTLFRKVFILQGLVASWAIDRTVIPDAKLGHFGIAFRASELVIDEQRAEIWADPAV